MFIEFKPDGTYLMTNIENKSVKTSNLISGKFNVDLQKMELIFHENKTRGIGTTRMKIVIFNKDTLSIRGDLLDKKYIILTYKKV